MAFSLPCYRAMIARLGVLDSYVELNELALRHFVESSRPSEQQLVKAVFQPRFRRLRNNAERLKKSVATSLRAKFGFELAESIRLAEAWALDPLVQG